MIELFLSSDGKHTVHVSADTPEQLAQLAPTAKMLYQQVLESFGNKAQMWQQVLPVKLNGTANGQKPVGKRVDTVEEARRATAPRCPLHDTPMAYRQGRFGPFWSCPTRRPDGRWCPVTTEVTLSGNTQKAA